MPGTKKNNLPGLAAQKAHAALLKKLTKLSETAVPIDLDLDAKKQAMKGFLQVVSDPTQPARARAEYMLLHANEIGLDLVEPVTSLVESLDQTSDLREQNEELVKKVAQQSSEVGPLTAEVFWKQLTLADGSTRFVLLTQGGPILFPVDPNFDGDAQSLRSGDSVLVDPKAGTVVALDGAILPVGDVVTVEEAPADGEEQAVIKVRDELSTAYVAAGVREDERFRPGAQAIYDASRRLLQGVLEEKSDGTELLTPISELSEFTIDSMGSPPPVLHEILRRLKRMVEHPEWSKRMQARERASYLFFGPTGTGKTCSIKALVNLVADWVEELTGVRDARLVLCDASEFYSPYFGETEQKIAAWFRKLARVARQELVLPDGRKIVVPIVLCFEEIEHLIRRRGEGDSSSHLFDRALSPILQRTDDIRNSLDVPIIMIGTTNLRRVMDPAGRRRFAQRQVYFGMLDAMGALSVLEKKIPLGVEIRRQPRETPALARKRLLREVLYHLFNDADDQTIARVTLRDGQHLNLHRRDVISGALLESAVSHAIDVCLDRSEENGELLGLDASSVIGALSQQLEGLATCLTPQSVADYLPHLGDGDGEAQVGRVEPVQNPARPAAHFVGASHS